jgi:hypothetical protein
MNCSSVRTLAPTSSSDWAAGRADDVGSPVRRVTQSRLRPKLAGRSHRRGLGHGPSRPSHGRHATRIARLLAAHAITPARDTARCLHWSAWPPAPRPPLPLPPASSPNMRMTNYGCSKALESPAPLTGDHAESSFQPAEYEPAEWSSGPAPAKVGKELAVEPKS